MSQERGVDGNKMVNGRKRHLIVDTLGLVWGVVVHAADIRLQLPIRAKSKIDRLSTITYPNPAGSLAAGAYFH